MKNFLVVLLCGFSFFNSTSAQSWHLLPNSPSANFRHDDLFFVNADTGWVVNLYGYIYKTTDGGNTWITQLHQASTGFRCVGFANANKGWAGNLGTASWWGVTDSVPLYQTLDGGNSWQPVSISGSVPKGLCGICVVNDTVVYAVGRSEGPAHLIKTTDGGASWTSVNFNPPSFYVVDCHFFSADTGIVVGCTGSNPDFSDARNAVFYTTDGGTTWQTVFNSNRLQSHCWKINFPSRNTGYISVETWSNEDSIPVLKTIDGGVSWQEKLWSVPLWDAQGIGFINDTVGWCGSGLNEVKETTDGGNTWNVVPFAQNFNRFRKVNDSVAYACGTRIWKYSTYPLDVPQYVDSLPGLSLSQNYPNPFCEKTSIQYTIPSNGKVQLNVYDKAGRLVKTLVDADQKKGTHDITFTLPYYFEGPCFCTLVFDGYCVTRKLLPVKCAN
jgi:photosystem II stability/assembly factor-like uncharacterized protein